MAEPATADHRRATAERNVTAILDAAEGIVARGESLTVAGVAAEAGVSRVTVYAHFANGTAILEAVVRRCVRIVTATFAEIDLTEGTGLDALDRLAGGAWSTLDRFDAIARTSGEHLPAEVRRDAHREILDVVDGLVARGRADGSIRADVPAAWQASVLYALIHTAADDIGAGRLDGAAARHALTVTLRAALSPAAPART